MGAQRSDSLGNVSVRRMGWWWWCWRSRPEASPDRCETSDIGFHRARHLSKARALRARFRNEFLSADFRRHPPLVESPRNNRGVQPNAFPGVLARAQLPTSPADRWCPRGRLSADIIRTDCVSVIMLGVARLEMTSLRSEIPDKPPEHEHAIECEHTHRIHADVVEDACAFDVSYCKRGHAHCRFACSLTPPTALSFGALASRARDGCVGVV